MSDRALSPEGEWGTALLHATGALDYVELPMKQHPFIVSAFLFVVFSSTLWALDYPGTAPGKANRLVADDRSLLENAVIRGEWKLDAKRVTSLTVENKHTGQTVTIGSGHLSRVVLSSGRTIDLVSVRPTKRGPRVRFGNAVVGDA